MTGAENELRGQAVVMGHILPRPGQILPAPRPSNEHGVEGPEPKPNHGLVLARYPAARVPGKLERHHELTYGKHFCKLGVGNRQCDLLFKLG